MINKVVGVLNACAAFFIAYLIEIDGGCSSKL